jgi:hypothetical protein
MLALEILSPGTDFSIQLLRDLAYSVHENKSFRNLMLEHHLLTCPKQSLAMLAAFSRTSHFDAQLLLLLLLLSRWLQAHLCFIKMGIEEI